MQRRTSQVFLSRTHPAGEQRHPFLKYTTAHARVVAIVTAGVAVENE